MFRQICVASSFPFSIYPQLPSLPPTNNHHRSSSLNENNQLCDDVIGWLLAIFYTEELVTLQLRLNVSAFQPLIKAAATRDPVAAVIKPLVVFSAVTETEDRLNVKLSHLSEAQLFFWQVHPGFGSFLISPALLIRAPRLEWPTVVSSPECAH